MNHLLRATLFTVLLSGAGGVMGAYAQPAIPAALGSDSTAWQRVIVHVVGSLASQIVQAAADPMLQPWRIDIALDEPHRVLLVAQLSRILRARTPVDGDSIVYAITLGPLRISGDTARVLFHSSVTRRCAGSTATTGWGNQMEIFVPRALPGLWGAARSTVVVHGDLEGCPRYEPKK